MRFHGEILRGQGMRSQHVSERASGYINRKNIAFLWSGTMHLRILYVLGGPQQVLFPYNLSVSELSECIQYYILVHLLRDHGNQL